MRTKKPKPKLKKVLDRSRIKKGIFDKAEYGKEFPLSDDPTFDKLNYRQKKFVYHIFLRPITNWSRTKCYQEAYDQPNYDVAAGDACNLVRNPKVAHCLEIIREKYSSTLYTNAAKILKEESYIAYSDPADLFDESGNLIKPIKNLPEYVRKSIKGFEVIENKNTGTVRYKVTLWDKGSSLGRLQSVAGLNAPNKYEVSGPNGTPIRHDVRKIEIVLVRSRYRDEIEDI